MIDRATIRRLADAEDALERAEKLGAELERHAAEVRASLAKYPRCEACHEWDESLGGKRGRVEKCPHCLYDFDAGCMPNHLRLAHGLEVTP